MFPGMFLGVEAESMPPVQGLEERRDSGERGLYLLIYHHPCVFPGMFLGMEAESMPPLLLGLEEIAASVGCTT